MNCEVELDLSWIKYCVLIEHRNNVTGVNFMITSTKRYVPVVSLSINKNIKYLGNLKKDSRKQYLGTNKNYISNK